MTKNRKNHSHVTFFSSGLGSRTIGNECGNVLSMLWTWVKKSGKIGLIKNFLIFLVDSVAIYRKIMKIPWFSLIFIDLPLFSWFSDMMATLPTRKLRKILIGPKFPPVLTHVHDVNNAFPHSFPMVLVPKPDEKNVTWLWFLRFLVIFYRKSLLPE